MLNQLLWFWMLFFPDSGDVELDAILGELCALGSQFEQELQHKTTPADPTLSTITATQHITTPGMGE